MVPEGWMHTSLGDLLEFKNGSNTEKANYGGGVPFINVSEVLKHESLTADLIPGSVKLSEAAAKAYRVKRGDILFNRTSETTEEVGFTSVYLDEEPVIFGGFVIRGRPKNGSLFPEFARYAMRQPQVRSEIIRRSQGAVRSNVGQGELSKVEITLPPLPEQRKIADILSTWDAAIEKTEALLATAKAQKRALMQSLLTGKRRFPEFEGQDWKEVRLGGCGRHPYWRYTCSERADLLAGWEQHLAFYCRSWSKAPQFFQGTNYGSRCGKKQREAATCGFRRHELQTYHRQARHHCGATLHE